MNRAFLHFSFWKFVKHTFRLQLNFLYSVKFWSFIQYFSLEKRESTQGKIMGITVLLFSKIINDGFIMWWHSRGVWDFFLSQFTLQKINNCLWSCTLHLRSNFTHCNCNQLLYSDNIYNKFNQLHWQYTNNLLRHLLWYLCNIINHHENLSFYHSPNI